MFYQQKRQHSLLCLRKLCKASPTPLARSEIAAIPWHVNQSPLVTVTGNPGWQRCFQKETNQVNEFFSLPKKSNVPATTKSESTPRWFQRHAQARGRDRRGHGNRRLPRTSSALELGAVSGPCSGRALTTTHSSTNSQASLALYHHYPSHGKENFSFQLRLLTAELHQFHPQRKEENRAINLLGQSLFMFLDGKRNPKAIESSTVNAKKASRIIDVRQSQQSLTIRIFSWDQLLQLIQLCRNGGMLKIKNWLNRTWLSRVTATSNHLKDRQTTEEEKLLFSIIGPDKHKPEIQTKRQ